MGEASLALSYVIFAAITIFVNLETISSQISNEMYRTINTALFGEAPGVYGPSLEDINDHSDVPAWLQTTFLESLFGEGSQTQVDWANFSENKSYEGAVTIGSFNRILLVRVTCKHWDSSATLGGLVTAPKRLAGGKEALSALDLHPEEDKSQRCVAGTNLSTADWQDSCFDWDTGLSYDSSGGFSMLYNPMEGRDNFTAKLQVMQNASLFDVSLSSVVVDFMVYNINQDMFLHYALVFTFDFAGNVELKKEARAFNLNVFNKNVSKYLILFVLKLVCLGMLAMFLLLELWHMYDSGIQVHFRRSGSVTEMVSILISLIVLLTYWWIESIPAYTNFKFEDLEGDNPDLIAQAYGELCSIALTVQVHSYFIAINLAVVSLRTMMLVGRLHSDLGLVLEVIAVSSPSMIAFSVMFMTLQLGFVFMGFLAFGAGYTGMESISLCFYENFAMLAGKENFNQLEAADPILGPLFYCVFFIGFYMVMINIFVTLLMNGYDIVDFDIKKRRDLGEQDRNPFVLLYTELKSDAVGGLIKYGSTVLKLAGRCFAPIIVSIKACFFCQLPSFLDSRSRTGKPSQASVAMRSANEKKGEIMTTQAQMDEKLRKTKIEFATMVVFMAVWTSFLALQSRGFLTYYSMQATLGLATDTKTFERISDFRDVETWADESIVGLYSSPICATTDNETGEYALRDTQCSNANDSQQILNQLNTWNVGFLNTTFVRLTIQPACYVRNLDPRWGAGFPIMRQTLEEECSSQSCIDTLLEYECYTPDGKLLNSETLAGQEMNLTVEMPAPAVFGLVQPGELGPFRELGGIAVSLGVTKEQCQDVLRWLSQEGWFSHSSASMVFDWITYNGNTDMFTHSVVEFNLKSTGIMTTSASASSFPLNVDAGGGFYLESRIMCLILMASYVCLLLYHIVEMGKTIQDELARCLATDTNFITGFFTQFWNVVDSLSLSFSVATFVIFMMYIFDSFRVEYWLSMDDQNKYVVPNDLAKQYDMELAIEPIRYLEDDWYFFMEFENLSSLYDAFKLSSAMNSIFIAVKTIKIVNRLPFMKIFAATLSNGKARIGYFLFVINQLMMGFGLTILVIFGTKDMQFSTLVDTLGTLNSWLCGTFNLDALLEDNTGIAVLIFALFIGIFRFALVNIFLATQLNTFAYNAGQRDIALAKQQRKETAVRLVEYNCKEGKDILKGDIAVMRREADDEVIVSDILDPVGLAAKAGIQPGFIVFKVNRQRDEWRKGIDDIIEEGMIPDKEGFIRIIFQEPQKRLLLNRCLKACMLSRKSKDKNTGSETAASNMKPTVRNFWKRHGAIAEIELLTRNPPEEEEAGGTVQTDDLDDEDEDTKAKDALEKDDPKNPKAPRIRAKRRLDGLLFSRWAHSKPPKDSLDEKTNSTASIFIPESANPVEPDELAHADIKQEGWDIYEMQDRVEHLPISGQEVWLDCLVSSVEVQSGDDSMIADLLRTTGMQATGNEPTGPQLDRLVRFYRRIDEVLKILESKSSKMYYQYLQLESLHRQEQLRNQNTVLHDYVCELEKEFTAISGKIHEYRTKKELMLTKLAGLLDNEYSRMDPATQEAANDAAPEQAGSLSTAKKVLALQQDESIGI
mmetsp:Transcript_78496/g.138221  ORF Transcript_78496/g.138221 Transcript_78496/m.138221 type:complete len:1600 (-) Transcript_78496:20-4819(-)